MPRRLSGDSEPLGKKSPFIPLGRSKLLDQESKPTVTFKHRHLDTPLRLKNHTPSIAQKRRRVLRRVPFKTHQLKVILYVPECFYVPLQL
jgi:hypothetical protein